MKNLLKQAIEKLIKAIDENSVYLWKPDLSETVGCILYHPEYIQDDIDDESTGNEYKGILENLHEVEKLITNTPINLHEYEELQTVFSDIMNLGMTLRQNQLNGSDGRSGNEVLEEYLSNITQ